MITLWNSSWITSRINKKEMTKRITGIFLLLTVLGFSGYAQNTAKANAILAAVSKKYKTYSIIKAGFTFTVNQPKNKVNQSEKGTLYVKAGANKYKMIMADREMISDGKNQWNFLKSDQEVQLTNVDNSSDALNPAQIFSLYEKGYNASFMGGGKVGGQLVDVINLTPTDSKKSHSKVTLSIDKDAKQIMKVVVYEKDGSTYTYNVTSFTPHAKVPESTFTFDTKKYPGVEVVDLR
jgi:outer membrane lipoprotein-sorting protein